MGFAQRFDDRTKKSSSAEQPGFVQRFERRVKYGTQELTPTAKAAADKYARIFEGYDWKSGLTYDEWDEEDQQRAAAGKLPKAVEKAYDFDDPIDVYLYNNGLPPKKSISSYAKKAQEQQETETFAAQRNAQVAKNLVTGLLPIPQAAKEQAAAMIGKLTGQTAEEKTAAVPQPLPMVEPYQGKEVSALDVDTVSGAAPTEQKGYLSYKAELQEKAKDPVEGTLGKSGRQETLKNPLTGMDMIVDLSPRQALAKMEQEETNAREALQRQRTWQAQEAEFEAQYAERYGNLSQNPDWAGRVRKGAAMELDREMQKSNPSPIERDPYQTSYQDIADESAGIHKYWDYFTPEERNVYNYLRAEDPEAAKEYYDFMLDRLRTRWTREEVQRAEDFAVEDPFAANLYSVVSSIPSAVKAAPYTAGQLFRGEAINPEDPAYALSLSKSAIRQKTAEGIDSDALKFLYEAGMSTADFAAMMPFGSAVSLSVMGANSFADTARDAAARGATTDEAVALGTVAAIAEVLTEKAGIERIFGQIGAKSSKTARKMLWEVAKSALSEGGEEITTEVVDTIADLLIMGDRAELNARRQAAVDAGMSTGEATRQVFMDWLSGDLLMSFLGGAVGGLMMSGPAVTINKLANDIKLGREIRAAGSAQETLDIGLEMGALSPAQYENLQGKELSSRKLGSIAADTQEAMLRMMQGEDQRGALELSLRAEKEDIDEQLQQALSELPTPQSEERSGDLQKRSDWISRKLKTVQENGEAYDRAARVADRMGLKFELKDLGPFSGKFENGTVIINPYQKNPVQQVLVHELTHHLETSGEYQALQQLALELYCDRQGVTLEQLRQNMIKEYAGYGVTLDESGADRELTAMFCDENLFQDEKSIETLSRKNPNVFQRIWQWIKDTIRKLRGTGEEKKLLELEQIYRRAARITGQEEGYGGAQYSAGYDHSKPFAQQVDDYKNGILPQTDTLTVGETPEVLQEIGFNALPMTINKTHVDYALNGTKDADHWIGEAMLKQLPEALKKPVAVIESQTQNGSSVVALLPFKHNGKTVIAPVYIDGFGRQNGIKIDSNVVSSTFGKGNAVSKLLTDALQREAAGQTAVYYLDKKEAAGLLIGSRVPMPKRFSALSDGFNHSIREGSGPVNNRLQDATESQQFRRWFGNSVETGADGRPRTLYHQTGETFSQFDVSREGAGATDSEMPSGIFMKPGADDIGVGGQIQMPLYASIQNPLVMQNREELVRWYEKNIPGYTEAKARIEEIDQRYSREYDEAEARGDAWYEEHYEELVNGLITDEAAEAAINGETDRILERWKAEEVTARKEAKQLIDDFFKNSRYDGLIVSEDEGSFGRTTETHVAFKPTQVKSTQNRGDFNPQNPDIYYSLGLTNEEVAHAHLKELDAELKETGAQSPVEEMAKSADPELSRRAKDFKVRYQRQFIEKMAEVFHLNPQAKRELRPLIDQIATETMKTGQMSEETKETLFEEMISRGMVHNLTFYNEYEEAANFLRGKKFSTEGIESDTRKALFGKVPYSKEGEKVDIAYQELSGLWPGLFPEDITNPNDQLRKIAEVKEALKGTWESIEQYYGEDTDSFRRNAWYAMESELYDLRRNMGLIERYETAKWNAAQERRILGETAEDYKAVEQALSQRGMLKKEMERARASELLIERDRMDIDYLAKGGELDLTGRTNREAILKAAEAQKAYDRNEAIIKAAKGRRTAARKAAFATLLTNSDQWKNVSSMAMSFETPWRVFEDVAGEDGKKLAQAILEPLGKNVQQRNAWMRGWGERIAALKLNKEESALVQLMGENRIPAEELRDGITYEDGSPVDIEKISKAVKTFREFYDEALDMANRALIRNGYESIGKREHYFPHIGEEKTGWDTFVEELRKGMDAALPTEIAGMTEYFTPGKKWFANFQQRKGTATANDAVRGFNRYIRGVADVIFLTDNIQDLRTLETMIREKYGMPKLEESELSGEEYAKHMSRFVMWLHEYTNLLAGKTSDIDRVIERRIQRSFTKTMDRLKKTFGANAVAGNLSTAVSNFIPLTQGIATMPGRDFLYGMQSAVRNEIQSWFGNNDGLWEKSSFLSRRFGDFEDVQTSEWKKFQGKMEKAGGFLFEFIDRTVAETLVRGKYHENLRKGMDAESAMMAADEYAMKTMADRSTGQMPVAFHDKLFGPITQFQLEVKNQLSNIKKDIPRWNDKNVLKVIAAYVKMAVAGWLLNEVFEKITGRRAAIDPIDAGLNLIKDLQETDEEGNRQVGTALWNFGENVLDALPFTSILTGGGRVPLLSGLEKINPMDALKKTLDGDDDAGKAWTDIAIAAAANFFPVTKVLPVGGAQLKKTVQGIYTVAKGGSYSGREGDQRLRFYSDQSAGDYAKAALFGQYALPEAQEYVENGFRSLSVGETRAFDAAREAGVEPEKAMEVIEAFRKIKPDKDEKGKTVVTSTCKKRKLLLEDKNLTQKQKKAIDRELLAGERGVADYSSAAMLELWEISEETYRKAKKAKLEGIDPELYLKLYKKHKEIKDKDASAREKATEFDRYLVELGLDEYTRILAEDYLGFYTQVRAQPEGLPDAEIEGLPNFS